MIGGRSTQLLGGITAIAPAVVYCLHRPEPHLFYSIKYGNWQHELQLFDRFSNKYGLKNVESKTCIAFDHFSTICDGFLRNWPSWKPLFLIDIVPKAISIGKILHFTLLKPQKCIAKPFFFPCCDGLFQFRLFLNPLLALKTTGCPGFAATKASQQ